MAQVIEIEGMDEIIRGIGELAVDDRRMSRNIRTILRKVLSDARRAVSRQARANIDKDPRKAYMAVRHAVYRRILGGQVNILSRRTNNGRMYVGRKTPRLRPGQRGGNRRKRSARTEQVDSYYGSDRGFILRFINAGTEERHTRYGRRGSITARNWFGNASTSALDKAAGEFAELVERAVEEVWTRHG